LSTWTVVVVVAMVVVVVGAVVVVVADATAGALMPRAAIMATATTPRVLNFFMWTPFKGTRPTVKFQFLKSL
jgi:ABC-type protease/lipase transport system fused ATPase/permease subunit